MGKICQECHYDNINEAIFCANCGKKILLPPKYNKVILGLLSLSIFLFTILYLFTDIGNIEKKNQTEQVQMIPIDTRETLTTPLKNIKYFFKNRGEYGDEYQQRTTPQKNSKGNYILATVFQEMRIAFLEFDKNGTKIRENKLDLHLKKPPLDSTQLHKNSLEIIDSNYMLFVKANKVCSYIKSNDKGEEIWRKKIDPSLDKKFYTMLKERRQCKEINTIKHLKNHELIISVTMTDWNVSVPITIKINSQGDIVWETFGEKIEIIDNNYITLGKYNRSNCYLLQYVNQKGDTVWKENINDFNDNYLELLIDNKKNIIVAGRAYNKEGYMNSKVLMIKFNQKGKKIWRKSFNSIHRYGFFKELPNYHYLFVGISSQNQRIIFKLNEHGNIIWKKKINLDYVIDIEINNNQYIITGKINDKKQSIILEDSYIKK